MRRLRHTLMPDNMDFEGIKLTPEQQKLRDELMKKQEEEYALQEEEEEQRRAERMTKQVTFVLDQIKEHPLIKEMIFLKKTDQKERYTVIALEALLSRSPTVDESKAKEIVNYAKLIGDEMALAMSK